MRQTNSRLLSSSVLLFVSNRFMCTSLKAAVIGCFSDSKKSFDFTPSGQMFDGKISGKLSEMLKRINFDGGAKKIKHFYNLTPEYSLIVVAGLGDIKASYCAREEIDVKLETIRSSIYKAIKLCEENEIMCIDLDDCAAAKCVGEIAALSNYDMAKWKSDFKPKTKTFSLIGKDASLFSKFEEGMIQGRAQTFAAFLAETPANLKTPIKIAELITSKMHKSVKCITRDKEWIKDKKMDLFLSVNQGSVEPPVLLEAHYKGAEGPLIILVGKGITFDSGGISIKPSAGMSDMKGDMQGAAVVFATVRALAELKAPVNVIGIAPFTDNLPSGSATRPGDVFTAMNGKTVEVDNTDAEGRLVLGDALAYADSFCPNIVIDLATLTGAVGVALGSATSAIYTQSPTILETFKKVAAVTGDRVWHMPLFNDYSKMVESKVADFINATKKRGAGSCTAAAFLREFVKTPEWAHIDIAGVMLSDKEMMPYSPGGMSGRPTRTLIEFVKEI